MDLNKICGINNYTMCHASFPDPFANVTFINEDRVYVNLFHNHSLTHYHMIYDLDAKAVIGKVISRHMIDTNSKNFPYKCFYNDERNEVYSFYR